MNIDKFFELSNQDQDRVIEAYNKQKRIKHEKENIENERTKLRNRELNNQNICTHPNTDKKYHGSSGNYDPSQDCFWVSFLCPDCGKRWNEKQ